MRILLDNIDFTNECSKGLQDVQITIRRQNEEGYIAFSFSSALTFIGNAYTYISDRLITDEKKNENSIVATVYDDCCGYTKDFIIRSNTINFCDNLCSVEVSLSENNEEVDNYKKLSQTIIWDNYNGFQNKQHPRIEYCTEFRPKGLHYVLIFLGIVINLILSLFQFILNIIDLMIKVINKIIQIATIGLVDEIIPVKTDLSDQIKVLRDKIIDFVFDTGRTHPAPLARDYIINSCNKWGIGFSSSILNDVNSAYYNTCIIFAPATKGTDDDDSTTYFIERDQPIMTCTQLLNRLKPVYNAEWRIVGSTLYFESKEYFINSTEWLDVSKMNAENIVEYPCYSFLGQERPALLHITYTTDAIDNICNEALADYEYYETWNNPYSPSQDGTKEVILEFAPARFREDGYEKSVYDEAFGSIVSAIFSKQKDSLNSMLLNNGKLSMPKIVIWDGGGRSWAKVIKQATVGHYQYNKPLWASEIAKFYAIDNPRNANYPQYEFTVTVNLDCDALDNIDINAPVVLSKGKGNCKEIILDFGKRTITIKGEI